MAEPEPELELELEAEAIHAKLNQEFFKAALLDELYGWSVSFKGTAKNCGQIAKVKRANGGVETALATQAAAKGLLRELGAAVVQKGSVDLLVVPEKDTQEESVLKAARKVGATVLAFKQAATPSSRQPLKQVDVQNFCGSVAAHQKTLRDYLLSVIKDASLQPMPQFVLHVCKGHTFSCELDSNPYVDARLAAMSERLAGVDIRLSTPEKSFCSTLRHEPKLRAELEKEDLRFAAVFAELEQDGADRSGLTTRSSRFAVYVCALRRNKLKTRLMFPSDASRYLFYVGKAKNGIHDRWIGSVGSHMMISAAIRALGSRNGRQFAKRSLFDTALASDYFKVADSYVFPLGTFASEEAMATAESEWIEKLNCLQFGSGLNTRL